MYSLPQSAARALPLGPLLPDGKGAAGKVLFQALAGIKKKKEKTNSSHAYIGEGEAGHVTPTILPYVTMCVGALTAPAQSCLECCLPLGLFLLSVAPRAAVLTVWQMRHFFSEFMSLVFNFWQCLNCRCSPSPFLLSVKPWPIGCGFILALGEATRPPNRRSLPGREKMTFSWHSTPCRGGAALTPSRGTERTVVARKMCTKRAP